MPSEAIQQFLAQGQGSGLFSAAEAGEMLAQATANPSLTTEQIAAQMIEKKILTPYQAEQLLVGRGEECLVAGRYTILDKLGAGGMGTVYKARDTKLDRLVALKVLPPQRLHDGDAIARFQREAKALARLSHPHIIQAYDSGEDKDRHFLIMEYVAGVTLEQVLRQRGALPPTMAADFIHQAALGLAHAHAKGLIHRDLKPGNLLVAGQPLLTTSLGTAMTVDYHAGHTSVGWKTGTAIVKVLDLGLARFLQDQLGDAHLTQEGIGIGTPDYMAPEQFRDAFRADIRTDIYGLGCTLYHLIAGQVPFPGSSYTEKAQAHAKKEPIPLEERCPELPGGLACVVAKMMAKHPDERFQTASEVTDALAPYVAGGSHSMIRLKQTGVWQRGQLTMHRPTGARRVLIWAGGLAAVVLLALLALASPKLFGPTSLSSGELGGQDDSSGTAPKPQVVTIENGWTVAKDGTGQFTTIGEALAKVQPSQTIRVLDAAVYKERLSIASKGRHAGITIEADGATLDSAAENAFAINIHGVPGVTVRGLRLRAVGPNAALVFVRGPAPGVVFERLELQGDSAPNCDGIILYDLGQGIESATIVVRDCVFRRTRIGVSLMGVALDYKTLTPCTRILVRDNAFINPVLGILVRRSARQVQIVGNRFWGSAALAAVQLENFEDSCRDILLANNTFLECTPGIRLWDGRVVGQNIQLRNNLLIGSTGPDMVFLNSGGTQGELRGPGDGKRVRQNWQLDHNWRELKSAGGDSSWIPPGPEDRCEDRIEVLSRNPDDSNFLRPANDSPLAKAGAGGDLPTYVGAVPPEGVEPWDWQKTWEARHPKMLFTVSKDPKDGGEYRTINEALAKVTRPGQTIRVLDNAVYQEVVQLRDRERFAGLTLESPRRATLEIPAQVKVGVIVMSVPRVTIRGFAVRGGSTCLGVGGFSAGTLLTDLQCSSSGTGLTLDSLSLNSADPPVRVENCKFSGLGNGIEVIGVNLTTHVSQPTQHLVIRQNELRECQVGIWATGLLNDLHIVGNRFWTCDLALRLSDLHAGSGRLLVANNSVKAVGRCLEITQSETGVEHVEIRNNLWATDAGPDLVRPGATKPLAASWRIDHNWRQARRPAPDSADAKEWIDSPQDTLVDKLPVVSLDPRQPGFFRPAKDSPLAKAGAGGDLPAYVGAVPPDGVEPWDWDKTWKARTQKPAPPAKTDSTK